MDQRTRRIKKNELIIKRKIIITNLLINLMKKNNKYIYEITLEFLCEF